MTRQTTIPGWNRRRLVLMILAVVPTACALAGAVVSAVKDEPDSDGFHRLRDNAEQLAPRVAVASSFVHFHGPVEGPEFRVKVPRVQLRGAQGDPEEPEQRGYALDYVAHPKYEFSYGVEDHRTGDFHGQKEIRDGNSVSGEYSVKEPGGGVRVVRYRADENGFHAVVDASDNNDHRTGAPSAGPVSSEHLRGLLQPRDREEGQSGGDGDGDGDGGGGRVQEYTAFFGIPQGYD